MDAMGSRKDVLIALRLVVFRSVAFLERKFLIVILRNVRTPLDFTLIRHSGEPVWKIIWRGFIKGKCVNVSGFLSR